MNLKIKIHNIKVTIDKELNTFPHEPKPERGKRAMISKTDRKNSYARTKN